MNVHQVKSESIQFLYQRNGNTLEDFRSCFSNLSDGKLKEDILTGPDIRNLTKDVDLEIVTILKIITGIYLKTLFLSY